MLTECVHAALKQASEIIVVDNASTDSSLVNLMNSFTAEAPLKLILTSRSAGFAAGCNIGLNASTQPYVLFLNPDCILEENSLQRLVHVLESDPCIGMVGGYLVNPKAPSKVVDGGLFLHLGVLLAYIAWKNTGRNYSLIFI